MRRGGQTAPVRGTSMTSRRPSPRWAKVSLGSAHVICQRVESSSRREELPGGSRGATAGSVAVHSRSGDSEPALFVGVRRKRLSQTILTQTFLRYARAAGVTERKHVTPHTLRHVLASELLRAGANLRQIQELLGHKHLDSTPRYTRVTAHELRGAIKRLRFAERPRRREGRFRTSTAVLECVGVLQ
jgi:site-specific recombinase XerC